MASRSSRPTALAFAALAGLAGLAGSAVLACGPSSTSTSPTSRGGVPVPTRPAPVACGVRLAERVASDATAADAGSPALPALPASGSAAVPGSATPASLLVVDVEVPLAGVKQQLEAKLPRRLAEVRDHNNGMAGRLQYSVDRGPVAAHVEAGVLVVETPLEAHVDACAKGSCYASCAPQLKAVVRVPLKLGADYRLHTSQVSIDVTRGCELHVLGGLMSIDVTPILRGALGSQSRAVQAGIDRELPELRSEASRLWATLAKPVSLPLGACAVVRPEALVQGTPLGDADAARLRFGLVAHPEVQVKCTATAAPSFVALPALRDEPALPALGDVHLAVVLPPDAPARAFAGSDTFELGGASARVGSADGDVRRLDLHLEGQACGDAAVSASGVAWNDARSLGLTGVTVAERDATRLTAAGLEPPRLARAVEHVPLPLPLALDALATMIPALASGASDARVTVTATVESAVPESAELRDTSPVAVAHVRGAVGLRIR